MAHIWIIGLGRFGLIALERLSAGHPDRRFTAVDPVAESLRRGAERGAGTVLADGVSFLAERLGREEGPDWIVPALPVHLAAEWCLARLGPGRARRAPLPAGLEEIPLNPMAGTAGDLYVSNADFQCPDDCPEPADRCTVTGKARKPNLFDRLADLRIPGHRPVVIRSHQLGPGVGGYRPAALFDLLDRAEGSEGPALIATACRCHGVLTPVTITGGTDPEPKPSKEEHP